MYTTPRIALAMFFMAFVRVVRRLWGQKTFRYLWRFYSLLFRGFFVVFSWLFRGPLLSRKTVFGPFSLLFRGFFVAFSWLFRGPRFGQILRVLALEQSSEWGLNKDWKVTALTERVRRSDLLSLVLSPVFAGTGGGCCFSWQQGKKEARAINLCIRVALIEWEHQKSQSQIAAIFCRKRPRRQPNRSGDAFCLEKSHKESQSLAFSVVRRNRKAFHGGRTLLGLKNDYRCDFSSEIAIAITLFRTRWIGANPEKSDLVNFWGPDWRKFSELCLLLFFLGKSTKYSQNPGLVNEYSVTPRGQLSWTGPIANNSELWAS